ncbi:MAG: PEP-CTERM sorting domain-containing protein [Kiritimatiellales bacterium]
MKKTVVAIAVMTLAVVFSAFAGTTLVFGFDTTDSGSDVNGIEYEGIKQSITYSGAVSGSGTNLFNFLDGTNDQVNFEIGAVGDLAGLSGTFTPVGGNFNIGGNGGAVDGGTSGTQFDSGEAWVLTFSTDVILNAVRYYGEDADGQTILTNGVAVAGSPFTSEFSGASIFVNANETLTFGQAGSGTYALQDFTITVIPEPATLAMLGVGGLLTLGFRHFSRV